MFDLSGTDRGACGGGKIMKHHDDAWIVECVLRIIGHDAPDRRYWRV